MKPLSGQFMAGKRIIVVGGSFAGLAFVLALHQLWNQSLERPEIIIIEQSGRQASLEKDPYLLCINGGSQNEGLVVLQQLGLLDDIRDKSILNGGDIRVWSTDWKQLSSINPKPYGNLPAATMRISREHLKRILVERAEKTGAVLKWSSKCVGAEQLPNGKMQITLEDERASKHTEDCDLLVAADGVNSQIRACFRPTDMKLEYTGATQIGGISKFPRGVPSPIREDYGLQMSSGEGVCCIYNPIDNETVAWALSRMEPEREEKNGSFTPEEFSRFKEEALKRGVMFSAPFQSVVEGTDSRTAFIRPAKERRAVRHDVMGVVFLGDSNHVLSPFEFVGANLALKDGWDLAAQLCGNSSMGSAIAAYDKLSILRFEHVFNFSHTRIRFGHSTGLTWIFYKYGMLGQRALGLK